MNILLAVDNVVEMCRQYGIETNDPHNPPAFTYVWLISLIVYLIYCTKK